MVNLGALHLVFVIKDIIKMILNLVKFVTINVQNALIPEAVLNVKKAEIKIMIVNA